MKHVSIFLDDNDYQKLSSFIKSLRSAHIKSSQVKEIEDDFSIPTWQQDLTLKRMAELDKQPKSAINFDDMIDRLEKKHGL